MNLHESGWYIFAGVLIALGSFLLQSIAQNVKTRKLRGVATGVLRGVWDFLENHEWLFPALMILGTIFVIIGALSVETPSWEHLASWSYRNMLWLMIAFIIFWGGSHLAEKGRGKAIRTLAFLSLIPFGLYPLANHLVMQHVRNVENEGRQQVVAAQQQQTFAMNQQKYCGAMGQPDCECRDGTVIMRYLAPGAHALVDTRYYIRFDDSLWAKGFQYCRVGDKECLTSRDGNLYTLPAADMVNAGEKTLEVRCGPDRPL